MELKCCPECGTLVRPSRLLKDGRRIRIGCFAILLLAIALTTAFVGPIHNGRWTKAIPSYPLVVLSTTSLGEHHTYIRSEVSARVFSGALSGRSASLLCDTLVKEFRDDEIRWNAAAARTMVVALWPQSKAALEQETMAGDVQSRIVASSILRIKCKKPTDILIAACIADLQDDSDLVDRYMGMWNAKSATLYLVRWWHLAETYVLEALDSADSQQRYLAAIIAGYGGTTGRVGDVVSILAPHLLDNDIRGDSRVAAPALYHLGPRAIPYLQEQLSFADLQGSQILLHIIERLEHPERSKLQCEHRLPYITSTSSDPLTNPLRKALRRY